jgi:hypothetical protein
MSFKESCGGSPRLPVWSNPRIAVNDEADGSTNEKRVLSEQAERAANVWSSVGAIVLTVRARVSVAPKAPVRMDDWARARRSRQEHSIPGAIGAPLARLFFTKQPLE